MPAQRAYIYSAPKLGNSSNGGLSSRHDAVTVYWGDDMPDQIPNPQEAVILRPAHVRGYPPHAVPVVEGKGVGPMFGGTFIYSSDSRFPSRGPIALHDRWESTELNEILSR